MPASEYAGIERWRALQVAVQAAIGEKVGNLIHNLGTFVAGIIVAFTKGWSMTLVMLAVVPFLALLGVLLATVTCSPAHSKKIWPAYLHLALTVAEYEALQRNCCSCIVRGLKAFPSDWWSCSFPPGAYCELREIQCTSL